MRPHAPKSDGANGCDPGADEIATGPTGKVTSMSEHRLVLGKCMSLPNYWGQASGARNEIHREKGPRRHVGALLPPQKG